ncbi:hypothetical protein Tco_0378049 [Tanacetum coccineum]
MSHRIRIPYTPYCTPVAPPSPDYIPGPEEPQTPPVPQDEDEREPMFIQPHDPDYVPEPMYPEYIPLEDEHVFLAEDQPLPPEYEDDETEDGPVDYPMDGGEDGDDDDGDSHGDDADDEDEDEEDEDEEDEEEEEEHLAPADSAIVVPTITVRLQASISLPPEAEGECLLSYIAPSTHSFTTPVHQITTIHIVSTQSRHLRIASTQALVDAVTTALPSPPLLPLLPSLYIPPVDCRDDIPKSERPPHKRSCLLLKALSMRRGEFYC